LDQLDAEVEINSAWETIREKESLGYYKLWKHKQRFDEGCSELLDQRKQAKLQWLQDPNEINGNNLNNVRCEANRHFWNKKRKYLEMKYICTIFIYLFIIGQKCQMVVRFQRIRKNKASKAASEKKRSSNRSTFAVDGSRNLIASLFTIYNDSL
jgi:hypothetical protein